VVSTQNCGVALLALVYLGGVVALGLFKFLCISNSMATRHHVKERSYLCISAINEYSIVLQFSIVVRLTQNRKICYSKMKRKDISLFLVGSEQSDFPTRVLYRLTSYTLQKKHFATKI
jgi:hypothetical protein